MNINDFANLFIDEEACIDLVRQAKETQGLVCPKCGSTHHYFNRKYKSHDCKKCNYRSTLRSKTVMESSKLPFRYWIAAIYFMTMTKKSFSALELQRILGHKRYEPIWAMMHKIRSAIGNYDEKQIMFGTIEMAAKRIITLRDKKRKIVEGNRKVKREIEIFIGIMPPKEPENKHLRKTVFKNVCAFVLPEMENRNYIEVKKTLQKGRFPVRGLNSFRTITNKASIMKQYHPENYEISKLHWANALFSNFQRIVQGIHHNIGENYIQNYLNEFSFKTSFKNDDLFKKLFGICISNQWYSAEKYESG